MGTEMGAEGPAPLAAVLTGQPRSRGGSGREAQLLPSVHTAGLGSASSGTTHSTCNDTRLLGERR